MIALKLNISDKILKKYYYRITKKYGGALLDESLPYEERKLDYLIAKEYSDPELQEKEKRKVRDIFLEYVYRNLGETSLIMYLAMAKRNDFAPHGIQRVSIGLTRCFLQIPNDCEVFTFDAAIFEVLLEECDKQNGCLSGDDYMNYCKNFSINIMGRQCTAADFDDVSNEVFKLMGLDYFIWATLSSSLGIRYALGVLEEQEIEGNRVLIMRHELMRSGQLILGLVAEIYQDTTIIRLDSIEVVFASKWQRFFDQTKSESEEASKNVFSAIREGFKKYAMVYSDGASNSDEVLKLKSVLLSEMLRGILHHEWGHLISHNDFSPELYDYHWVFPGQDSIGNSLQEALADWAPQRGTKKGPFVSFSEMNKTDGTRNIYFYLSDYFFIDADEMDYYSILTDVMVSTAISFLNPIDGTLDLELLNAKKDDMYAFFLQKYSELVDKLLKVVKTSEYDLGIKKLKYTELELKICEMLHQEKRNVNKTFEELKHTPTFYENVLKYLEQFSVGWENYQKTLAEESQRIQVELLNLISNNNAAKFNNRLRDYIVQKCFECGIIEENAGKQLLLRHVSQKRELLSQPFMVIDQGKLKTKTRRNA
jgi:hypothetical protein